MATDKYVFKVYNTETQEIYYAGDSKFIADRALDWSLKKYVTVKCELLDKCTICTQPKLKNENGEIYNCVTPSKE